MHNSFSKTDSPATPHLHLTLEKLDSAWPSEIVARSEVGTFSGGLIKPRYLANLDSKGQGPEGRFMCGAKTAYDKSSLLAWLNARIHFGEK